MKKNIAYEKYVPKNLEKYRYSDTESILNEWTLEDSANVAEMILEMQNTNVEVNADFGDRYYLYRINTELNLEISIENVINEIEVDRFESVLETNAHCFLLL